MGISFKVSKTGKRFRPRAAPAESAGAAVESPAPDGSKREINTAEIGNDVNGDSTLSSCSGGLLLPEHEVSFTLNLFHKGFFIGKPSEEFSPLLQDIKSLHPYDRASETLFSAIESGWLPGDILDDIPSKYFYGTLICEVRDYRKCTSEQGTVGSSLNGIPVINRRRLRMSLENVVKDIPLISDDSWTYSDLMEVESRILKALRPQLCLDPTPMLDRLCHETISTKLNLGIGRKRRLGQTPDVTVTSNTQTHGKKICIDRLPENANHKPGGSGNILGDSAMQRAHENAAIQHVSSGHLSSLRPNNFPHEMARPALPLSSQPKCQPTINYTGVVHGVGSPANFMGANTNISSPMNSYTDTVNSSVSQPGKRENQDQLTPMGGIKRTKHNIMGLDSIQQQQEGPQFGLSGTDLHWKNQLVPSQLDVKGMQYTTIGGQRYPSQVINNLPNQESGVSFCFNQQGMRYGAKEEQIDTKLDEKSKDALHALASESNSLDQQQLRSQQLSQQALMRNHLPPFTQWHSSRASAEKDMRKDDMLQKRKSVNSPRVSSGPMVQSPVSSKSGEISSGSVGQFSAVATTSALGSQKDKATANSNAAVGAPSVTSSPSDSLQRQHQAPVTAKRKANSISKTQAMSGVGSPASVSNMNPPLNASSPSIGTAPMGDQVLLERFSKIEMIAQRCQLHVKKTKVDDYSVRKPIVYSSEKVALYLNKSLNDDDYIDPIKPLTKSIIGGTSNTYKTRLLSFERTERVYQVVSTRSQNRLIMHEKPSDGSVAMQYGDTDDSDYSNGHDCLLTLPTSNDADLLAAQFILLMEHDGYKKTEDHTRMQIRMSTPTPTAVMGMSDNSVSEVKHPEVASGQPSNVSAIANSNSMGSLSSSQNLPNSARLLACANGSQGSVMSQGFMPGAGMPIRTQQLEQPLIQPQQQQLQLQQNQQSQMQQQQQQQQQHLSHLQRSPQLLSTNPLSQLMGQNSNLQMGTNPMVNKPPNHLQLQMLQQAQQQQQQQTQLPRKVMMNLGAAMGMGNMASNMMGLGGLSNVMGMGGVRGISSPIGPISGLGNISPNQMNLGTTSNFGAGLRPGTMPAAQAAALAKLRMAAQNRAGMYGQSGIAGIQGSSNQMLPSSAGLSMLGQAFNRTNISPLQRNVMAPMGPPKIPGTNFYLNPQQQLQLQQHQQLQQQQQQQQQLQQQQQQLQQQQLQQQQQIQQQQQQQISSPLQQAQVGSPPVVGSPQAMVMQQHQISPQQIGQQTAMSPQQLSSGTLQHINNNAGAPPASPQLSSQTHGSVGSITSSPMEQLQGANKGGPVSNV